jgi:hypothetical protein
VDNYRIKIKIGEHEFEAEGPSEIVQSQFDAFRELIATSSARPNVTTDSPGNQAETNNNAGSGEPPTSFDKIMRVDGRIISLTVRPESDREAALLVMLGQKRYRDNEPVTASEIRDGMEHSGYRFARVDRLMRPLCDQGLVIQLGAKKSTRYRLTNPGMIEANVIASRFLAQVA